MHVCAKRAQQSTKRRALSKSRAAVPTAMRANCGSRRRRISLEIRDLSTHLIAFLAERGLGVHGVCLGHFNTSWNTMYEALWIRIKRDCVPARSLFIQRKWRPRRHVTARCTADSRAARAAPNLHLRVYSECQHSFESFAFKLAWCNELCILCIFSLSLEYTRNSHLRCH